MEARRGHEVKKAISKRARRSTKRQSADDVDVAGINVTSVAAPFDVWIINRLARSPSIEDALTIGDECLINKGSVLSVFDVEGINGCSYGRSFDVDDIKRCRVSLFFDAADINVK